VRGAYREGPANGWALVGAEPRHVVLTSGGTEANMIALTPALETSPGQETVSTVNRVAIEHLSVRGGERFPAPAVEELSATQEGVADLGELDRRLRN